MGIAILIDKARLEENEPASINESRNGNGKSPVQTRFEERWESIFAGEDLPQESEADTGNN